MAGYGWLSSATSSGSPLPPTWVACTPVAALTAGLPGGNRNTNGNFNNAGNNGNWWSSSPSGSNAWNRNLNNDNPNVNRNNNNQRNGFSVRCLRDADTKIPCLVSHGTGDLFALHADDRLLEGIFEAYYECRKNKRNKAEPLAFELNFESELLDLHEELLTFQYTPAPYRAFLVERPVLREVFAARFKDRVVHHWLMGLLNPHIEALLSDRCFACRKGLGVHAGHRAIQSDLAECPEGWVLKLDVRGFFMSIDRERLFKRLTRDMKHWNQNGLELWVQHVLRRLLLANPLKGCIQRPHHRWSELPQDKSLLRAPAGFGLPIGNLTSQIFANYFLNPLDQWIQGELGFHRYGRYVDDFYIVHRPKSTLRALIPATREFLSESLGLKLHPHKIYLQPVAKGVPFLGAFHHMDHAKLTPRLKGNMWRCLEEVNLHAQSAIGPLDKTHAAWAIPRLNSYLGLCSKLSARRWERKWLKSFDPKWWKILRFSRGKMIALTAPPRAARASNVSSFAIERR